MNKLKYIKLENDDGSYSDAIPLSVDGDHVDINGTTLTNKLNTLATKQEVQAVASGSPAGVYATVAALTNADPDHSKIYLVSADGHWYYYNNNNWVSGGIYQSTSIADNYIKFNMLSNEINSIFDLTIPDSEDIVTIQNIYVQTNGNVYEQSNFNTSRVNLKKGYTVKVNLRAGSSVMAIGTYKNNIYTSIIAGNNGNANEDYYYTATEDCIVAFSYNHNNSFSICTYLKEDYIMERIDNTNEKINDIIKYNEPQYTIEDGKYIYKTGQITETSAYSLTSPIEIEANKTMEIKVAGSNFVAVIAKKNTDNSYTPLVLGTDGNNAQTYKYTPIENMNIVISYRKSYGINVKNYYDIKTIIADLPEIHENIENIEENIAYLENKRKNILSIFSNISCFGDSLTYSQVYTGRDAINEIDLSRQAYRTWPETLGIRTGANIENLSTAGYTASQWWNKYKNQIVHKDNQLCIIYLGTNSGLTDTVDTDCAGDNPDNFADTNTGNYGRIIAKCLSVGAKVLLVKIYAHLPESNNAIEDLAEKFNVAWVKNDKLTDIIYHYWPDLQGYNNTHYNDLGYNVFADKIIENVSNLSDDMIKRIYPN